MVMLERKANMIRRSKWPGAALSPYLAFLALDIWSLRNVLMTPGIIGHSWDWGIPAFTDQSIVQALSTFWSWDDLFGGGSFNPLKSLFNYFIDFPLSTWGGEIHSKLLVVLLLWGSATGMYILVRRGLRLNPFWSTVAGVLYMLSPITYSRLISGYLNLIVAQALLPILILLCIHILQAGGRGSLSLAWKVVAAGIILGVCQATHSSIFILAPFIVAVFLGLGINRANARRTVLSAVAVFIIGLLINISWITSFGISYLSSGALFHGGGSEKPTDQITLASVTDWRQGLLDSTSQPLSDAIRLNAANGVATEIEYPIPDSLANMWLFVSFLFSLIVFALLLVKQQLTPVVLAFFILGIVGVAMVSGTRTVVGYSVFQSLRIFAPPAWAEFGNTTRAFPLVVLSYSVLVPLMLEHLSGWLINWISLTHSAILRNGFVVVAGVLLCGAVAVWSVPFLSGDITRSTDKVIGLHQYSVQPSDLALYDFLRSNPNDSRATVIPPPGIWGVTDYGWVWEAGNVPPRPKFLAPTYNSGAWRAASDFSVYTPNSRAGKLLGLAAVDRIIFPFARNFDASTRAKYNAVLTAQSDFKQATIPLTGTMVLDNLASLPRIYAATNSTMILGSSDLLPPLSTTAYVDGKPALFFSTQEPTQDLETIASHVSRIIVPFQTYTITASPLITSPVGFAYRPVSIDTRPVHKVNDSVTHIASFPDTSAVSEGTFSVTESSKYVIHVSAYTPASNRVVMEAPAVALVEDYVSEVPTEANWKVEPVPAITDPYKWDTTTLFDKHVTDQGILEVRAALDPANENPRVDFTIAVNPFDLNDFPVLHVAMQAQDPAVQLIELHLGLDWNGDGVADDDWTLPIAPGSELKSIQLPIRDYVRQAFPGKSQYNVVSIMVRLTRRPKIDLQRVHPGLYSFGLTEISFHASNQVDEKGIHVFPADAPSVESTQNPVASDASRVFHQEGLAFTYPTGDNDTMVALQRALPPVSTDGSSIYKITYQADGPATFVLDLQIIGIDANGTRQQIHLGTRWLGPFSDGTIVFNAPQLSLSQPQVMVTLDKLVGSIEPRDSSIILSQFQVSRQVLVPYKEAHPDSPFVSIDGLSIALVPMPPSGGQSGTWFTSRPIDLAAGNHSIRTGYRDSTTPYRVGFVEVTPDQASVPMASSISPTISYRQINPTRYLVHVKNATTPFFLVFSESFHTGWQAFLQEASNTGGSTWYEQSALLSWMWDGGKRTEIANHELVNGYANSWYVQKKGSYDLVLEFAPQRSYEAGVLISIITPVVCFIFLAVFWLERRRVRGAR